MKNQTNIEKLITSGKKVFTIDDLAVIWQISDRKKLVSLIKYYLRRQRLTHVYKGVYAYGNYHVLDVAQKLTPMSYLSLYTTAQMHGLIFQNYSTTFAMSLKSNKYDLGGEKFEYHKLKDTAFYNALGLVSEGGLTFANRERTICDLLYVYPGLAFDNLRGVDSKALAEVSRIYGNRRLEKEVAKLIMTEVRDGE